MVINFGESLNYKSGLGFFVSAVEVPFLCPNSGTLGKSGHIEGPKNGTSSAGTELVLQRKRCDQNFFY